jgi:hypothetical protein
MSQNGGYPLSELAAPVMEVSGKESEFELGGRYCRDEAILARFGKKQQLKVF